MYVPVPLPAPPWEPPPYEDQRLLQQLEARLAAAWVGWTPPDLRNGAPGPGRAAARPATECRLRPRDPT